MVDLQASFTLNDQDDKASKRWKRSINRTGPSKDETAVSGGVLGNIARNMYIKVPTVIKIEIIYISTTSDKNKATR